MKGKNTFSKAESEKIKTLIRKKLDANATEQKTLRASIRKVGFYFTDFYNIRSTEYNLEAFESLIKTGKITIL